MKHDEQAMLRAWATTLLELSRIRARSLTAAERHRFLFGRGGLVDDMVQPTQPNVRTSKRQKK